MICCSQETVHSLCLSVDYSVIVEDDASSKESYLGLIKTIVVIFRHFSLRPCKDKEERKRQDDCTLINLTSPHGGKEDILHQSCLGTYDLDVFC